MITPELSAKVKIIMAVRNIDSLEMAKQLDIAHVCVKAYVSGKTKYLKQETANKFQQAFDFASEDLSLPLEQFVKRLFDIDRSKICSCSKKREMEAPVVVPENSAPEEQIFRGVLAEWNESRKKILLKPTYQQNDESFDGKNTMYFLEPKVGILDRTKLYDLQIVAKRATDRVNSRGFLIVHVDVKILREYDISFDRQLRVVSS